MPTAIGWWGNWNNATPQPAQKFTPVAFLDGAAKQLTLAGMVYSCYAVGSFGSGLHRKLAELGVKNFVVQPQKLDELNKDVKTDKTDALLITDCFKQHPAHVIFTLLPGAGPKLSP